MSITVWIVLGLGAVQGRVRAAATAAFVVVPFAGLGVAVRPLRVALAVAGSMSFQGGVIGWVAIHRRHHAFADRPGDPHSPYRYGTSLAGQLRGLAHAHTGWLLRDDPTPPERYAPDMTADPAMRAVSAAFPALQPAGRRTERAVMPGRRLPQLPVSSERLA